MAILNISLEGANQNLLFQSTEQNIKFIIAKSLTYTAKNVQKAVKEHIKETFVIRRKAGGFEQSIKILPATKTNLEAKVYTMAGFAALQQTGGIQRGNDGRLAIPLYNSLKEVKPKTVANRPRSLKNSFLIRLNSGAHALATRQKKVFKIMYYLKSTAFVPKRLNMLEIGEDIANQTFALELQQALKEI